MTEILSVKMHGDGAAQIVVKSLDYCQSGHCLFLWQRELGAYAYGMYLMMVIPNVLQYLTTLTTDIGLLTRRALPKLTTAYCTPCYVGFCWVAHRLSSPS